MVDCIDCIHFEVCKDYIDIALKGIDDGIINYVSDGCKFCKDRSRFVELPCKVGDRLYVPIPKSKYIAEYVVIAFWIEESGTIIRIVDIRFFTVSILFTRDIGTKAFLTKEEAEQALKVVVP